MQLYWAGDILRENQSGRFAECDAMPSRHGLFKIRFKHVNHSPS